MSFFIRHAISLDLISTWWYNFKLPVSFLSILWLILESCLCLYILLPIANEFHILGVWSCWLKPSGQRQTFRLYLLKLSSSLLANMYPRKFIEKSYVSWSFPWLVFFSIKYKHIKNRTHYLRPQMHGISQSLPQYGHVVSIKKYNWVKFMNECIWKYNHEDVLIKKL